MSLLWFLVAYVYYLRTKSRKSTEQLSFADNTKTHYILRQIYE